MERTRQTKQYLPSGLYRHYKGGTYLLLGVAAHSETDERLVIYVSLNDKLPGPRMRARPLGMFMGTVSHKGMYLPRFEYIGLEKDDGTKQREAAGADTKTT